MDIIAFLQQLPFSFSMSLEEATGTEEQRTLYGGAMQWSRVSREAPGIGER